MLVDCTILTLSLQENAEIGKLNQGIATIRIPSNIIAESVFAVRILDSGWEIDVSKELILAVEETTRSQEIYLNRWRVILWRHDF
jgi:hypothetical protein